MKRLLEIDPNLYSPTMLYAFITYSYANYEIIDY